MVSIDPKYTQQVSGKPHVTFKGLVAAAHAEWGDRFSLESELLEEPDDDNNHTAIVRGRLTILPKDESGNVQVFTGIGDANPANTNRMIAPHAVRMAETRAYGRALRFALNVEEAVFEELGGDTQDDRGAPQKQPSQASQAGMSKMERTRIVASITDFCRRLSDDGSLKLLDQLEDRNGNLLDLQDDQLTRIQASLWKRVDKLEREGG